MPAGEVCEKCGQEHVIRGGAKNRIGTPSCAAHRTNGGPCTHAPRQGQKVCGLHGGNTKRSLAKAQMNLEEQRARTMLARLNRPEPIQHPVYELLDLAAESREWQRILRERLEELKSFETTDNFGTERERAVVTLYTRALEQNSKLLVDMAKLDLQTRSLALQQSAASQVMEGVVKALHRVGLGEHEVDVRAALADELRKMKGEPAQVSGG